MYELKEKAVRAAEQFLVQRGYEIVESNWMSDKLSELSDKSRSMSDKMQLSVKAHLPRPINLSSRPISNRRLQPRGLWRKRKFFSS